MQTIAIGAKRKKKGRKATKRKSRKAKAKARTTKGRKSTRRRRKATTSGRKVARPVRTTSGRKPSRRRRSRRRTASGPMNMPMNRPRRGPMGFLQLGDYWRNVGMRSLGQAGGMFAANVAGGFLSKGVNWVKDRFDAAAGISDNWAKAITSILGSYLSWRFVPNMRQPMLRDAKDGAITFFGFSAVMNLLKAFGLGEKPGLASWLGFGADEEGEMNTLMTVGNVGSTAVLTEEEVRARMADVGAKKGELESALAAVVGPLNANQEAVYAAAAEHIASVDGPLDVVEFYLGQGNLAGAETYLGSARNYAQVAEALLSGLTAGLPEPAPVPAAEEPPIAMPDVVPIADAATGEVVEVPAPAPNQVEQPTAGGAALNLDMIYPWSQWVAQQKPGWSPSEVASAFVLKYLANSGHTWGYGPNAVTASRWGMGAPNMTAAGLRYGNTPDMSVGGARPAGVGLLVGSSWNQPQVIPCGASQPEVAATVGGIFENYYGSY